MTEAQSPQTYVLEQRSRALVPTPHSQRRRYDGCHHPDDWKEGWSEWDWLQTGLSEHEVERRLEWWRDLNRYSVSIGGTPREFRARPEDDCEV